MQLHFQHLRLLRGPVSENTIVDKGSTGPQKVSVTYMSSPAKVSYTVLLGENFGLTQNQSPSKVLGGSRSCSEVSTLHTLYQEDSSLLFIFRFNNLLLSVILDLELVSSLS